MGSKKMEKKNEKTALCHSVAVEWIYYIRNTYEIKQCLGRNYCWMTKEDKTNVIMSRKMSNTAKNYIWRTAVCLCGFDRFRILRKFVKNIFIFSAYIAWVCWKAWCWEDIIDEDCCFIEEEETEETCWLDFIIEDSRN